MTATVTKVATTGMLVGLGILHPDDVLSVDVLVPCCGPRSCCTTYTPGNQNGCSVGPADFALGRAGRSDLVPSSLSPTYGVRAYDLS